MKGLQLPMLEKKGVTDSIRSLLLEEKRLDNKLLRGLGRGTWDLIKVELYNKRLRIYSSDTESILIKILNQVLPEEQIRLKIKSSLLFGDDIKPVEELAISYLTKKGFKIKVSFSEDSSSIKTDLESSGPKDKILDILRLFLGLHRSTNPYNEETEIELTYGNYIIFRIDGKNAELQFDIEEKKLLEALNLIFASDNKSIPCSYQFSVSIKKITGNWKTGKREGFLVQELKDKKETRRKKFKL